ncbi:MFS transporter [Nocardia sp. NPDC050713]|uniref:MFS transporter n=1 Tax=Nocardia sp. NPDC050713 TaxID=3154511 RepID=UPI0033C1AB9F
MAQDISSAEKPSSITARTPFDLSRLWRRQLDHYPPARQRYSYLAITVLSTVVLYYELYVQGAVATTIITTYGVGFTKFVMIAVVGSLLGAFASLAAGLADRWGRANLVTGGLFVTGLLVLFGLPMAPNVDVYAAFFILLSIVEGMVLVATPALIRDFSPQMGRATAMGFWTLGPVLGSLLVTTISSNTLDSHPDWQFQFRVCGAIGVIVAVIALLGLRELSPALRDQLMVSLRDRALIEARAAGIDPDRALEGQWRQMLKLDVLGSAFAISVYLIFYYISVGFFVVYFATVFDYPEARANALANWYWLSTAIALVASGFLSDRLRVRKPFMIGGALLSAGAIAVFASLSTETETGYYHFATVLVLIGSGTGFAYCAWMASFTETVERHNPAATATGLAVWAWINRIVVTLALAGFTLALPAVSTLVDQGHHVSEISARYQPQLETLRALEPPTKTAILSGTQDPGVREVAVEQLVRSGLAADVATADARLRQLATDPIPRADQEFLATEGPVVTAAMKDNPAQWQRWWFVCLIGQLAFIPLVFVMAGRWSPKRAREDEARHQVYIEQEMKKLGITESSGAQ